MKLTCLLEAEEEAEECFSKRRLNSLNCHVNGLGYVGVKSERVILFCFI